MQSDQVTNEQVPASPEQPQAVRKVCICLPTGESIKTRTALCLMSLIKYLGDNPQLGIDISVTNHQCSILPWGRSSCVEDALAWGSDYLFWIDSDMWFPPQVLQVLLGHKKDVVGCVYAKKLEGNPEPVLPYVGQKFEGLQPVPSLATGMLLVKAECFKKLSKPYFEFKWQEFEGHPGRWLGEDVVLSDRLRDLGYVLWCDFELSKSIGHIGDKVFNLNGFKGGYTIDYEKLTSSQPKSLYPGSDKASGGSPCSVGDSSGPEDSGFQAQCGSQEGWQAWGPGSPC